MIDTYEKMSYKISVGFEAGTETRENKNHIAQGKPASKNTPENVHPRTWNIAYSIRLLNLWDQIADFVTTKSLVG